MDYLITENEIRTAVKKSKIVKSPFLDKIRNKMIKASLNDMLPVYYKLVNAIINSGTMPQTWCGGLITPVKLPWYLYFIYTLQISGWLSTNKIVQQTIFLHNEP